MESAVEQGADNFFLSFLFFFPFAPKYSTTHYNKTSPPRRRRGLFLVSTILEIYLPANPISRSTMTYQLETNLQNRGDHCDAID
jgi:hypothetical protein